MRLEWKPPHGVAGPIPVKNLTPNHFPETLLLETAFPPDDRSLGWERGTAVSKAWDQAATDAALETAAYVTAHLGELSGARDGAADRAAKLRDFCGRFAERAFRRPLTAEQKRIVVDHQFEKASDPETAARRVKRCCWCFYRRDFCTARSPADPTLLTWRRAWRLVCGTRRRIEELLDAAAA